MKLSIFSRFSRAAHLWRIAWAESNRPAISRQREGKLVEVWL